MIKILQFLKKTDKKLDIYRQTTKEKAHFWRFLECFSKNHFNSAACAGASAVVTDALEANKKIVLSKVDSPIPSKSDGRVSLPQCYPVLPSVAQ